MSSTLSIDVESRSTVNLRARPAPGAFVYFEDTHADVLCAAWAFDDEAPTVWRRGDPCPPRVAEHIRAGGIVSGWNVSFERLAFEHVLGPRYGWPVPAPEQYRDSMAQAAAMALPLALGECAKALAMEVQKDTEGNRLIQKFCKPRRARKGETPGLLYWNEPKDHPEDFEAFCRYCSTDVVVERSIRNKLVPLSDFEQAVWHLDQKINHRGIFLDKPLVEALDAITLDAKTALDRRMAEATGYEITATSQASALAGWVNAQGFETDGVDKNAVAALLERDDIPDSLRETLEIRLEGSKTSTAKLASMKAAVCKDGRIKGTKQYHGASTGRWAGRLTQVDNMPRGTGTILDPEAARDDFLLRQWKWIEMVYGSPLYAVSDMLRSCFSASPGCRLIAADFSSIEGRVTAWLAGEEWKLEAFRANDRGEGAGAYELAAAGIFSIDPAKVAKDQRQVGKAAELGLGFAGGVMAFKAMADIYGVRMEKAYEPLRANTDPEVFERAIESHEKWSEEGLFGTEVLNREAWIASEVTKVLWRQKHPAICQLWDGLEDAIKEAVRQPGTIATYGKVSYIVRRGFLWARLPSGRCLAYGAPQIEDTKTPWGASAKGVTVVGMKTVKGGQAKWMRYPLNKSVIVENVVQAVARDLLVAGMMNVEAAGYPLVLHVHDEAVADTPEGFGSLKEFEQLLCELPDWAKGLPIKAEGWEGACYRK